MNKKWLWGILAVCFVLFLGGATMLYNYLSQKVTPKTNMEVVEEEGSVENAEGTDEENTSEEEPIQAPDVTFYDKDGNEVKLSDFFGKPIVMNFWASWCPPCKQEMPDFDEVHSEMGEEITFLMIDMVDGGRETMEKGLAHIEKEGYTFPVYFDIDQEVAYTYGAYSIPTTYFLDKDGYIIAGAQGAITKDVLLQGIGMITEESVTEEEITSQENE